jgi:NADH-quinone oxidoreductase subunit N
VFVVLMMAAKDGEEPSTLDDLKGLASRSPMAGFSLVVFVLSLIGLGPVSGFLGKVFVLKDALNANLQWLALVMVLNSIFGAFYYFGILKSVFSPEAGDARPIVPTAPQTISLAICVFAVVGSVVFYAPLLTHIGLR